MLGRPVTEEDVLKLIAFLKKQESNGKYFSRAMQTGRIPGTAKETDGGDDTLSLPS